MTESIEEDFGEPCTEWSEAKLTQYIRAQTVHLGNITDQLIRLTRKTPVIYFWMGKAHFLLKEKFQQDRKKAWIRFILAKGFKKSGVYEAIAFYELTHRQDIADSVIAEEIEAGKYGDTITQVKEKLGITKPKTKTELLSDVDPDLDGINPPAVPALNVIAGEDIAADDIVDEEEDVVTTQHPCINLLQEAYDTLISAVREFGGTKRISRQEIEVLAQLATKIAAMANQIKKGLSGATIGCK